MLFPFYTINCGSKFWNTHIHMLCTNVSGDVMFTMFSRYNIYIGRSTAKNVYFIYIDNDQIESSAGECTMFKWTGTKLLVAVNWNISVGQSVKPVKMFMCGMKPTMQIGMLENVDIIYNHLKYLFSHEICEMFSSMIYTSMTSQWYFRH